MKLAQLFFLRGCCSGPRGVALVGYRCCCRGLRREKASPVSPDQSAAGMARSLDHLTVAAPNSSRGPAPGRHASDDDEFQSPIGARASIRDSFRQTLSFLFTTSTPSPVFFHHIISHGHVLSVCCAGLRSPDALLGTSSVHPRCVHDETIQLYRSRSREPQDCRHCRPDQPAHSPRDRRPCLQPQGSCCPLTTPLAQSSPRFQKTDLAFPIEQTQHPRYADGRLRCRCPRRRRPC